MLRPASRSPALWVPVVVGLVTAAVVAGLGAGPSLAVLDPVVREVDLITGSFTLMVALGALGHLIRELDPGVPGVDENLF